MVEPIRISRGELPDAPYAGWNAFVRLLAFSKPATLTANQLAAQRVFIYDGEVQNGGHWQFFENVGAVDFYLFVEALNHLSAHFQANILSRAIELSLASEHEVIDTSDPFFETASDREMHKCDEAFYRCQPTLNDVLEKYFSEHESEFVVFVD